ncbi:MAG TPA: hypothetical protein VKE40_23335 [Gemmataceae bacterium]|nr:hypothetical protein [Gemmataceae bacterium]
MGSLPVYALPILLTLGSGPGPVRSTVPAPPVKGGILDEEDAGFLDALVQDFLFDPKDAIPVRVPVSGSRAPSPNLFLHRSDRERGETAEGWFVRGVKGQPARVYFADGDWIPAPPGQIKQIDFEAYCIGRYSREGAHGRDLFADNLGAAECDLMLAAWLHRRGYDLLATKALAAAREGEKNPREALRVALAKRANQAMLRAFCARADAEALAHAERLFRLYADLIVERYPQAEAVLGDLKRRQAAGTFGKVPPKEGPRERASWDTRQTVGRLISALEEIDRGPEDVLGGWPSFTDHALYQAVAELGESAVPELIDAVERDERLTRCPEIRGSQGCCLGPPEPERVASVRDVVLRLLQDILRVRHWDPVGPEGPDDDSPRATAARLRHYWSTYGRLPFDDRMMAILTNPGAHASARREATEALLATHEVRRPSWSRWPSGDRREPPRVLTRFKAPTVAEAILTAMDQERAQMARENNEGGQRWDRVEDDYVDYLIDLGDGRAGPELARRAGVASNVRSRIRFARAAHALGVSGPLVRLARDTAAGPARLAPGSAPDESSDEATIVALRDVVELLADSGLPDADEALYALVDPAHPYYRIVSRVLLVDPSVLRSISPWKSHPFCLAILGRGLKDRGTTGVHYYLRGNEVEESNGTKPRRESVPADPDDRDTWLEHVEQRVADVAAERLSMIAVGLPAYHPLRRDADRVLTETKAILDRHARGFRPMTPIEMERFDSRFERIGFIPDIRPLARPATPDDVRNGRAVFHLDGKGKVSSTTLPAWLVLKADAEKVTAVVESDPWEVTMARAVLRRSAQAPAGLVVQVEVGPDGKLVYGVIFRNGIRAVRADEVDRIEPYEKK